MSGQLTTIELDIITEYKELEHRAKQTGAIFRFIKDEVQVFIKMELLGNNFTFETLKQANNFLFAFELGKKSTL